MCALPISAVFSLLFSKKWYGSSFLDPATLTLTFFCGTFHEISMLTMAALLLSIESKKVLSDGLTCLWPQWCTLRRHLLIYPCIFLKSLFLNWPTILLHLTSILVSDFVILLCNSVCDIDTLWGIRLWKIKLWSAETCTQKMTPLSWKAVNKWISLQYLIIL